MERLERHLYEQLEVVALRARQRTQGPKTCRPTVRRATRRLSKLTRYHDGRLDVQDIGHSRHHREEAHLHDGKPNGHTADAAPQLRLATVRPSDP